MFLAGAVFGRVLALLGDLLEDVMNIWLGLAFREYGLANDGAFFVGSPIPSFGGESFLALYTLVVAGLYLTGDFFSSESGGFPDYTESRSLNISSVVL